MPLTLVDILARQNNDRFTGLIEDVSTYAPEASTIPVVTREGIHYDVCRRTALPTAAFRLINDGSSASPSTYKKERKEMFFLDAVVDIDEALTDGDDGSTGNLLTDEMNGVLQASLITIGAQVWYGMGADSKGFAGVRTQLSATVAAGGTTNSTSAYLCWLTSQGMNLDIGQNGAIQCLPPQRYPVAVASPGSGTAFHWMTNLRAYVGLGIKSKDSAFAITGITNTESANAYTQPLNDRLASKLLASVPRSRRVGLVWFMNRLAYATLEASRSSIAYQPADVNGRPAFAPPPEKLAGFPIVQTDSILNTENN